ncbi:MAG: EAL domain-containing protein [Gammaproteobacteria bacterium]|nr:EAL domain-containing protein [Gammaproteobacteria bacterium]
MKSLQNTIFFFVVLLLLAVQAAFFHTIYKATKEQERDQISYQLNTAKSIFHTEFKNRRHYLAAFAETVAKDFGLKQVFQEDTRSFLVALNNHRQRIDADIAIAITAEGEISAQLVTQVDATGKARIRVGPEQGLMFRYPEWLQLQDDARLYALRDSYYQLNLAPLKSGSLVIGWIGFGFQIDQRLAQQFARQTGLNSSFVIAEGEQTGLLATSRSQVNGAGLASYTHLIGQIARGQTPQHVIAATMSLGEVGEQKLLAVIYGDRGDLLTEIRKRWQELGLLAALILSVSLAGAYIIAARIGRPLRELKQQAGEIAAGNYDLTVDIQAKGELGQLAAVFHDMQQAVLSREQTITHQAFHDDLSGLPNRNRLLQVLAAKTGNPGNPFSITKLSVRRIKDINSSLGHEIGDQLIMEVARRLQRLQAGQGVFHLGGSEFIVIHDLAAAEDTVVNAHGQAILKAMEPAFRYQSISLYIEVQLGLAVYPADDLESARLLQKSAIAHQYARSCSQPMQVYNARMCDQGVERLQLINDLKIAIQQNQLELYYQPKLDLATATIGHVEALVRWHHPLQGMIPPDTFIGIAEQTGLINSLTLWVLQEAARQYRQWTRDGVELSIAVNISAENLKDKDFYTTVLSIIDTELLARKAISLEMTESVVVAEPEAAIAELRRLQALGLGMAIDDYGTGYSSLAQLKQLPVGELKIDRSFVQHLTGDADDQVIVKSTIELAHQLQMRVVAEGVEDVATLNWLRNNACDLAQGYYICRPKPAAELLEWLAQRNAQGPAKIYSLQRGE